MANLNTLTLAPDGQSNYDATISAFEDGAGQLPGLDAQRITQTLPAIRSIDEEPYAVDTLPLPDVSQAPTSRDVGYLATKYAAQQFWDRFDPGQPDKRRQNHTLGKFILSKIPGASAIRDDVASAARQLAYYQSQSDDELADAYPGTARLRRKLVTYELRSTARSIVYHALEPLLVRASDVHYTRKLARYSRQQAADLARQHRSPDHHEAKDTFRSQPAYSSDYSAAKIDTPTLDIAPGIPGPVFALEQSPGQPALQLVVAATTLGPVQGQGPFLEKPRYRTLRATMPAPLLDAGPPKLSRLQPARAPTTTPFKRAPATTPLTIDAPQPPIVHRGPLTWPARVVHVIASVYQTYNAYGRTLSSGLYPPPTRVVHISGNPAAPPQRPHRSASPITPRQHAAPGMHQNSRYPIYRQPAQAVLARPGTSPETDLTPRYARFLITEPGGIPTTHTMWGIGATFDRRIRDWRTIHPLARLLDQGPADTFRARHHPGNGTLI